MLLKFNESLDINKALIYRFERQDILNVDPDALEVFEFESDSPLLINASFQEIVPDSSQHLNPFLLDSEFIEFSL